MSSRDSSSTLCKTPEFLAAIAEAATDADIHSISYTGNAEPEILHILCAEKRRRMQAAGIADPLQADSKNSFPINVQDYQDRFGISGTWWADEDTAPTPSEPIPDRLKDMCRYFVEGFENGDLHIHERTSDLGHVLNPYYREVLPKVILLAVPPEARDQMQETYAWENYGGWLKGRILNRRELGK